MVRYYLAYSDNGKYSYEYYAEGIKNARKKAYQMLEYTTKRNTVIISTKVFALNGFVGIVHKNGNTITYASHKNKYPSHVNKDGSISYVRL